MGGGKTARALGIRISRSHTERSSTPSKRRTDLTKTNLTPYMKFPGHARQAMEHYYKALGDKLELRGQA